MTTSTKTSADDLVAQEHCIDLPGETVQCWLGGGTDKLKVILRKHRDVIFDIHLGNGKTYSLETTESDFYNPRDKKLIYAAKRGKVTFKDGERMHVWVSRGFRGALILKCDDHVLSRVEPNEWDTHRHSDDPKEKPAPIIITISQPSSSTKPLAQFKPAIAATLPHEEHSLHVHEASKDGAPPIVLKFFEDGGKSLQLESENIITRNWIAAQLAGAGGYVFDNHVWIKELMGCKFHLQKVIHKSAPKVYMIFTGNNKIREMMSASRYSLQHTKIMRITGGAGGMKQSWDAAKGATKDSFKMISKEEGKMVVKGGGLALVFTISMDIAEWHKDYSEIGPDGMPKKDFYDLFAKLGTDLVKAGLITALATASVAVSISLLASAGVIFAAPVFAVVIGTIAFTALWTYSVEKGDRAAANSLAEDDLTTWLAKKFRDVARYLSEANKDIRYDGYEMIQIY